MRSFAFLDLGPLLGLGACLSVALAACTTDVCQRIDEGRPPTPYREGHTNQERTVYQTSTWNDEPWLSFPSGARYSLEHGLGREPVSFSAWISLDDKPFETGESATLTAGNEARTDDVSDQHIVIGNDTCSDVFLRVVAWTEPQPSETPAALVTTSSDAGTVSEF